MPDPTQQGRLLKFTSPLGPDVLLAESFRGMEGISQLFEFQVELLAERNTAVAAKAIVGKKVTIDIQVSDSGAVRNLNGIVNSFEFCGGDEEFNVYRAYIVPKLWLLTRNTDTRVFQTKTVIEVIKAVLAKYLITLEDKTQATYKPLDYCTQYRETDFAFISRLMEQHGIFYHFVHTKNDHSLTLQDTSAQLAACNTQSTLRYAPELGKNEGFYDFVIHEFSSRSTWVTGKTSLWDYRWIPYQEVGGQETSSAAGPLGDNADEEYDYADSASAYAKTEDADKKTTEMKGFFQEIHQQITDAASVQVAGQANAIVLESGFTFKLTEYPQSDLNTKYLLTSVEHVVQQLPSFRTHGVAQSVPYNNQFTAVPSSIPYRTQRRTPKPRVNGMHTGEVVVPAGEESHLDKYGRVCVQFWWDRLRKPNQVDKTLLRVAQPWAGKGWGTYFWPRIGDEVLIDFIEGDPDQPIVVGSVYNGVNMPKYDPASQYTRAGILTRSSKGGDASTANELRFEDLKGSEQIFMNAERDMDHRTENDHRRFVGGKDSLIVKGAQYDEITGDRQSNMKANLVEKVAQKADLDVGTDLTEKVGSNYSLKVGQNHGEKVGQDYALDAGMEVYIKAGMTLVIESGMELCLKGAGGFITIGPAGIAISGTMVMINSGGAAVSGSPPQVTDPAAPKAPDQADDGTKGGKM